MTKMLRVVRGGGPGSGPRRCRVRRGRRNRHARAHSDVAAKACKKVKKKHAKVCAKATKSSESSGSSASGLPSDPCSLLTLDEVHTMVASATAGKDISELQASSTQSACTWKAADTDPGLGSIVVTVSQLPGSVSAGELKLGLDAEARDSGKVISGIGSHTIVTSSIPADAEVKALVGKLLLDVDFNGTGAGQHQDQVIAAAKAAAGRL